MADLRSKLNALLLGWRIRKQITQATRRGDQLVLIYQMGKVGSRSLERTLYSKAGLAVFHTHVLSQCRIKELRRNAELSGRPRTLMEDVPGTTLHRTIITRGLPVKAISLVREPIGRNVSAYFQNLDVFQGQAEAHEQLDSDSLVAAFLRDYDHHVPLEWFDVEPRQTLGIDVYATPFPRQQGFATYCNGPHKLLVMRHDLDDGRKAEVVSQFLDIEPFDLRRHNVSTAKAYASLYQEVLRTIRLPREYVDRMLDSKYARHFYADEELARLRERWTGRD